MNRDSASVSPSLPPASPWQPRRATAPELIDDVDQDPVVLAANLEELARINRWLGGTGLTLRALDRLLDRTGSEVAVLDVGTGAADIPEAVRGWLERRQRPGQVVGIDRSAEVIRNARQRLRGSSGISLLQADGLRLPFPDRAFDVTICSFLLHHLEPADAVALLREMARVSRRGIVVNDLIRSWWGYLGALVVCRLLSGNRLTRHDGPLSALRAYTRAELAALLRQAGLGPVRVSTFLGYRMAVTADFNRRLAPATDARRSG